MEHLPAVRRRKEHTLIRDSQRTELVVLVGEFGGRFPEETHEFVRFLARAKSRSILEPLRTCSPILGVQMGCRCQGVLRLRGWIVGATRGQMALPRRMLKFWLFSAGRFSWCRFQHGCWIFE